MSIFDTHRNTVLSELSEPLTTAATTDATNTYFNTRSIRETTHQPSSSQSSSRMINTTNNNNNSNNNNNDNYISNSSSIGSAAEQFTSDGLSTLNKIKEKLPANVQPWFWLGLWFGFVVLILVLFTVYRSKIFGFLEALANFIRNLGPFGPPIIMLCMFATSFPPVIGYSSIITMSGYVYGFVFGFVIAFSGALAGGIVCFYFCRRWFKPQVRKLMAKNKSLKSVVRTVENKGFRLLVLIRLAPYPFNVMNALLSATHIPLHTYTLATAISLVKLTLHVYIGSTLSSLTEGDDDEKNPDGTPKDPSSGHGKKLKVIIMIFGIILGIGVGAYVWLVAKREIAMSEATRAERRRRRRRQQRQQGQRRINVNDDNNNRGGIELSEHNRLPNIDLTNGNAPTNTSDFVGGLHGSSRYADEDEDGHEDQFLFGGSGGRGLGLGIRPAHTPREDWRNSTNENSSTDSEDDDRFDFLDDSDDSDEDQDLYDAERGYGYSNISEDIEGDHEEPALDFSAHHDGHIESPWQEDGEEDGASPVGFLSLSSSISKGLSER